MNRIQFFYVDFSCDLSTTANALFGMSPVLIWLSPPSKALSARLCRFRSLKKVWPVIGSSSMMRVGELLRPISAAMGEELLSGSYIQADETTVGVQMHDGRGKNHQAYLWQYSHPAGPVVFDFRLGREREGPKRFLGNFEGLLQSDVYGA
jgi:Transposase IS66 family